MPNPYATAVAFPMQGANDNLKLELGDNFTIRPSSSFRSIERSYTPCNESGKYDVLVQWDAITPLYAPTDETQARIRDANGE
jgi:hypothetical protein